MASGCECEEHRKEESTAMSPDLPGWPRHPHYGPSSFLVPRPKARPVKLPMKGITTTWNGGDLKLCYGCAELYQRAGYEVVQK